MSASKKLLSKKAILAVACAGATLNFFSLPALAKNGTDSSESVIEQLRIRPEARAWLLLMLANDLLDGRCNTSADVQSALSKRNFLDYPSKFHELFFVEMSQQIFSGARFPADEKIASIDSDAQLSKDDVAARAKSALDEAMTVNVKATPDFAKLHNLLMARHLYQKLGNSAGIQSCDMALNKAILACEKSSSNDPELVKAVSSILNLMAFRIIPVRIADHKHEQKKLARPYTDEDFEESEQLKLRAAAIADHLAATSDVRRKVHRDLAIWYMELGKLDKADKEKEVVFELVGSKDDRILYPIHVGCGGLVWWQIGTPKFQGLCGMG